MEAEELIMATNMFCKNCGNKMDEDADFCTNCGTRKDAEVKALYCDKCGTKISAEDLFCTGCGNKLVTELTATSPDTDTEKNAQKNIEEEKPSASSNDEPEKNMSAEPSISAPNENDSQNVPDTPMVTTQEETAKNEIDKDIDTNGNNSSLLPDENNRKQEINSEEPKAAEEISEITKEESATSNAEDATVQNNAESEKSTTHNTEETENPELLKPAEPINQTPYTSYQSSSNSGLIAACLIGWIAFIISLVCAINNYSVADRYEARYNSLTKEHESLTQQFNDVQGKFNDVINAGPWAKIVKVYNMKDNSTELRYNKITYLGFDYKLYSNSTLNGIKVKIIDPWGSVSRGTGSPAGYSYTIEGVQYPFQIHYANGWGNEYPGTYSRGNWKIELWHNDKLLTREVVNIK